MSRMGKMVPQLIKMLGRKSDTVLYPAVKAKVSERFRGSLAFHQDKCIGCKLCMRNCPSNAILIERVEGVEEKLFKATVLMDKCIFCGQCVDSCNKNALENSSSFELACSDRNCLKVEI